MIIMIRVNFIIENFRALKYLGCSTAAQQFVGILREKGVEVEVNSKNKGFDILHAHTFGPVAILQAAKNKNAVKIVSAHSTPSINKNNIIFGGCKFWNIIYSSIYNRFDYVLSVSPFSVSELKKIGVKKPIIVVENGVDTKKFSYDRLKSKEFREKSGFSEKDLVVLNVAQVTPRKGVYDFIEVARRTPEFKFVWVGGFPYKLASADYLKLRKIVKINAGLENLNFMGFVPDIVGAYSGSDVLLSPSFAETFGLTIIEAGACKLPVIARDLGVFRELFGDKIEYGSNCEEFMEKIKLFRNKKFRKKQGESSHELSKRYNIEKIADKLFRLYKELLGK